MDPDFLTGYNCINFDLCYLINRAHTLKAEGVTALSRLRSVESKVQDGRFSSRALGTHDTKEIAVEGRVQFDVLELVRREYKLKSYTLNYVSFEFLKEQKVGCLQTDWFFLPTPPCTPLLADARNWPSGGRPLQHDWGPVPRRPNFAQTHWSVLSQGRPASTSPSRQTAVSVQLR